MADPIGVAGLALSGISLFFQVYAGTVQGRSNLQWINDGRH